MTRHYGNQPSAFEKIIYMTLEQQAEVIKLIEEIAAADHLTIPRIIISIDNNSCWIRSKNDERYHISMLGISPIIVFVEYMRAEKKLLIGEPSAQKAIEEIGSVAPLSQEITCMVTGRNLETGLPARIEISSVQVREALLSKSFDENFVGNLKRYFSYIPFRHQISDEQLSQAQIILRESLRNIRGLSDWLEQLTGLKTIIE